jgi:hypothetical protein
MNNKKYRPIYSYKNINIMENKFGKNEWQNVIYLAFLLLMYLGLPLTQCASASADNGDKRMVEHFIKQSHSHIAGGAKILRITGPLNAYSNLYELKDLYENINISMYQIDSMLYSIAGREMAKNCFIIIKNREHKYDEQIKKMELEMKHLYDGKITYNTVIYNVEYMVKHKVKKETVFLDQRKPGITIPYSIITLETYMRGIKMFNEMLIEKEKDTKLTLKNYLDK